MSSNAIQLLKQLASGVRPTEVAARSATTDAAGEAAFAQLLSQARSGELSSHKVVNVGEDAGVELSQQEIARLSLAADRAEAEGVRTALVMFDDKQVILDVPSRTVTGRAGFLGAGPGAATAGASVLGGVDGVINLSEKLSSPEATGALGTPSAFPVSSGSLGKLLEMLQDRDDKQDGENSPLLAG